MELDASLDLVQIQFFEALIKIFFLYSRLLQPLGDQPGQLWGNETPSGGGQCMTPWRTDALTQGVRHRWLAESGRSRWKEAEFQEGILCVALLLFVPTQKPVWSSGWDFQLFEKEWCSKYFLGRRQHSTMVSIHVSRPSCHGFDSQHFQNCHCWLSLSSGLLSGKWTVAWKCWSDPSINGWWQASYTKCISGGLGLWSTW